MATDDYFPSGFASSSPDILGELWLPDRMSLRKNLSLGDNVRPFEEHFLSAFPSRWNSSIMSSFSSPVQPSTGSEETQSEDDNECMAGLAERVARSMLDDDEDTDEKFELGNRNWTFQQKKDLWRADSVKLQSSMAVTPKSTLPGIGSWSTCSWSSSSVASSEGSSGISFQSTSPPSTLLRVQNDAWDLIYAAILEVVRLQMLKEMTISDACGPAVDGLQQPPMRLVPPSNRSPGALSRQNYTSTLHGVHLPSPSQEKGPLPRSSRFSASDDHRPSSCEHGALNLGSASNSDVQVKHLPQKHSSTIWRSSQKAGAGQRTSVRSSQWPLTRPAGGSGMRAVFLASNGLERGSSGTGVFLPRCAGGLERKKKLSCSTVLLPTRIVQALNLNAEDIHALPARSFLQMCGSATHRDASYAPSQTCLPGVSIQAATKQSWADCERRQTQRILSSPGHVASEITLPTEWTY